MSQYEEGETVGSGKHALTVTKVHDLPEGRTIRMYDVEFPDGTVDTFTAAEIEGYVGE